MNRATWVLVVVFTIAGIGYVAVYTTYTERRPATSAATASIRPAPSPPLVDARCDEPGVVRPQSIRLCTDATR